MCYTAHLVTELMAKTANAHRRHRNVRISICQLHRQNLNYSMGTYHVQILEHIGKLPNCSTSAESKHGHIIGDRTSRGEHTRFSICGTIDGPVFNLHADSSEQKHTLPKLVAVRTLSTQMRSWVTCRHLLPDIKTSATEETPSSFILSNDNLCLQNNQFPSSASLFRGGTRR